MAQAVYSSSQVYFRGQLLIDTIDEPFSKTVCYNNTLIASIFEIAVWLYCRDVKITHRPVQLRHWVLDEIQTYYLFFQGIAMLIIPDALLLGMLSIRLTKFKDDWVMS